MINYHDNYDLSFEDVDLQIEILGVTIQGFTGSFLAFMVALKLSPLIAPLVAMGYAALVRLFTISEAKGSPLFYNQMFLSLLKKTRLMEKFAPSLRAVNLGQGEYHED